MPDILFRSEQGLECSSACLSCNSTKTQVSMVHMLYISVVTVAFLTMFRPLSSPPSL